MSRSPIHSTFRRLFLLSLASADKNAPPVDEILELEQQKKAVVSRRQFLGGAIKLGALAATTGALGWTQTVRAGNREVSTKASRATRVAIIGGGIAGLNAAYQLKRAGVNATVYEASNRVGGRMFTARGLLGANLTTELGGEFIDSTHADIFSLAQEFNVSFYDRQAPSEAGLQPEGYYFDNQVYTEREIIELLRPYALVLQSDAARLEIAFDEVAPEFDMLSLAEYFDRLGVTGVVRHLLVAAFTSEYGLEPEQQTALNLFFTLPTIRENNTLALFGESDERYKVVGGNQVITDQLAARLQNQIVTNALLTAIRQCSGGGYTLSFERREVEADFVIMTLPFSLLRQVNLRVPLSPSLRQFIYQLRYGTHSKVFAGFDTRVWRAAGLAGNIFTNRDFQLCWDNTQQQPGTAGGLTYFSGGREGLRAGTGSAAFQAERYTRLLDQIVPGALGARNDKSGRFVWPSYRYNLGSYACFTPGQYTSFINQNVYLEEDGQVTQTVRAGNLIFAGEHLSDAYQGYMNGGAQTGRIAAQTVLSSLAIASRTKVKADTAA